MEMYNKAALIILLFTLASQNACATECPVYAIIGERNQNIYNYLASNIQEIDNTAVLNEKACFSFCAGEYLLYERFYNEVQNECSVERLKRSLMSKIAEAEKKCAENAKGIEASSATECKILYSISMPIRNIDNDDTWVIIRKDYREDPKEESKMSEIEGKHNKAGKSEEWVEWEMFYVRYSEKSNKIIILEKRNYEIAN